jgi:hypothetical protein
VEIDGYRLPFGWPTAGSILLILGVLAYGMRDPWLRSWRTVLAALVALVITAAAIAVPWFPRVIIRSALLGVYAVAVLIGDRRLWSIPRADGDPVRRVR